MKIGFGLPNQVRNVRPETIPQFASAAEQAGFSTLGTVGRYAYPGVSDTITLAAAAGATKTIGLFSHVMLAPVWPGELLAKELAGIDGVSGHRLTVGIGVGGRPDDFAVDGFGMSGRGKRMDRDLEVYRSVWKGEPVGGGTNPAVPAGTREIPLIFGGGSPAAYARMAREGVGYVGGSMPASMVAPSFEAARAAWKEAGRSGDPRIVGIGYVNLGAEDEGRNNVRDYYSFLGDDVANLMGGAVSATPEAIKEAVKAYEDLGADEFILIATTDDTDEVSRLAEIVF
ncbi:LLM class flavin-dependent oxidoreductase [Pseudonocardia xinjiangensis]|uniref:LLM class flavin-dependent oxidoreductase n=1 Tax=Pseudonocardia xinjiangensis TaxID=75289 RepID=A0ABX1RRA4_9PSEU|nr:LLM class flavin-dependent oxidoreductase [Pseudonocardia xinjiangensis]NMH81773.1 LLM class flavin-dependent oxidoreductase [Pseudonocardia xinjiangensis]